MFPLKVLNRLRLAGDVAAEVVATLPNHKAWVLIRPEVDTKKAVRDKISRRWTPVYMDGDILAGFKVNYVEIETKQIEAYFTDVYDTDIEPTVNERFRVSTEEELASLVPRWVTDLSTFREPSRVRLGFFIDF